jgi:hypothetical protein
MKRFNLKDDLTDRLPDGDVPQRSRRLGERKTPEPATGRRFP